MRFTTYTTQAQLREAFWDSFPNLESEARKRRTLSKGQNAQTTSCRSWFVDFIDTKHRQGQISDALADRATL